MGSKLFFQPPLLSLTQEPGYVCHLKEAFGDDPNGFAVYSETSRTHWDLLPNTLKYRIIRWWKYYYFSNGSSPKYLNLQPDVSPHSAWGGVWGRD